MDADPEAARSFIESANRSWSEAYRRGDTRAMAEFYSPDASLSLGSSATLEGRASIIEYFAGQHSLGAGAPSLETLDVVTIGDVAYEIGTYGMPSRSDGESGDSGRYVAIWKSHEDGWRCQLGIWTPVVAVNARP